MINFEKILNDVSVAIATPDRLRCTFFGHFSMQDEVYARSMRIRWINQWLMMPKNGTLIT